jgi:hypothetical protein
MWTYNTDYRKWYANDDSILKDDFDYLKQELRSTRLYSRCLSGATYLPVNNLNNIYDILGDYKQRTWYISTLGSQYSVTTIPPQHASPIDLNTSNDYYTKYLSEYGLTLKNLFTPYRLIKDSSKNFYYVDVATDGQIDLTTITKDYYIDGVKLLNGHRVLVKDQKLSVVLLNSADPNTYFTGQYSILQDLGGTIEYEYYSEENGIYLYRDGELVRENDLDDYDRCVRYSVSVKLGNTNAGRQFHLSRLINGYFPTVSLGQPIEFKEKNNWILRNRVDYNNLFEINYYDIIKHGTQSYNYEGYTYSIPERTLSVGEFGIILNTQEGKSNIIKNKYKVNLRSITETSKEYWICGDENTLLKVRKHDFFIDRILIENIPITLPNLIKTNLSSVSFFNDLVGVVVGELNTIIYTKNGGYKWERIEVADFSEYNYNKVLYSTNYSFYVAGNNGILIEFINSVAGWIAYKRRVSQIEDSVDEYILVENINDLYKTTISTWNVSYNYYTQSIPTNKELLFLVTNNSKVIAYDVNNSFSQIGTDFIYFDFGKEYGNIRNITQTKGTNKFYFTGTDPISGNDGIFSFDISNFGILGTGSSYSNTTVGVNAVYEYNAYPNEIFDYDGSQILMCGNNSLLGVSTYSTLNFNSLDSTFEDKLKSKLLVIDYDVASKLNFFTDAGEYRLPNSVTFSNTNLNSVNSKIEFNPIQQNQTSTNNGTYSETNWITYWTDSEKTFEYYNITPMDESTKVLISTTFSYDAIVTSIAYNKTQITASASLISLLAPAITMSNSVKSFSIKNAGTGYSTASNVATTGGFGTGLEVNIKASDSITSVTIASKGSGYKVGDIVTIAGGSLGQIRIDSIENSSQSRFNGYGMPPITAVPTTGVAGNYRIFIYDYLLIYKVGLNYPVSVGDAIKFESGVVDKNLIVNKVTTIGSWKFIYMYTEFNQNMITDLLNTPSDVKITNLNKYTNVVELKDRFNEHPISNAYKLDYLDSYGNATTGTSSVFQLSARFNNLTSYYNLQTSIIVDNNTYDMVYTNNFLKFGYSPTYNLLDYLTNINDVNDVNPKFYATKEYLSMPQYEGLPLGSLTSNVYIDYNGMTASLDLNSQGNKITFGPDLKLEWQSIFINTFVDVIIHGTSDYKTERLLVMDKYYDSLNNVYVVEFHKRLNFNLGDAVIGNGGTLDIISRRRLSQISDDLQELNNIQRTKGKSNSWKGQGQYTYDTYENELNFKIPTDSYAKILLSDADTIQSLSSIIYIDYKNELAMNITRLSKEYNIAISNTINYTNKLYITCAEKHDLITGEGVVLEFTGGDGSSQELNPQYAGYHVITKINEYDFTTDIDYGQIPTVGIDSGYVKYTKQDPFLNYQPVDLIDLGVDGKGKISLELSIENLKISNVVYSLIDVDFEKYRFRLIDGLNIETVNLRYSWLLEAEVSGALVGLYNGDLVWYKGTWIFGRWFGGTWQSGVWMSGDWYGGTWNSNIVTDKKLTAEVDTKTVDFEQSFWYTGRWYDGTWNAGIWNSGRWYAGTWNNGMWHKGTWNDGTWNDGRFEGGIWISGTWNKGIFNCDNEPAYWLDGKWYGGDFENGMWYNGYWEQKNTSSRFGTKSFNSRTANWQAGTWVSGSFYSYINTNDKGVLDVSDVHKYSIWKTGQWLSGEWYGGIAYSMDFKTGTWYGGILEDIEVIGIDIVENTFTLNGIFKFNIGDTINIIDNQIDNANSVYGSNLNPTFYRVLYQTEDTINKRTIIYVDVNLNGPNITPATNTGLRVVSKFKNLNWKSGIWTNGIYETGLWEGGIWYNGVFSGTWA